MAFACKRRQKNYLQKMPSIRKISFLFYLARSDFKLVNRHGNINSLDIRIKSIKVRKEYKSTSLVRMGSQYGRVAQGARGGSCPSWKIDPSAKKKGYFLEKNGYLMVKIGISLSYLKTDFKVSSCPPLESVLATYALSTRSPLGFF